MVSSPETDVFTCGGRAPLFHAMDEAVVHGEVDGWRDWELLARGRYLSGQRRMLHLLRIFTMPGSAQGIRQLLCVTPQWGDGGGTFTYPRGWVQTMEKANDGSGKRGLLLWGHVRCLWLLILGHPTTQPGFLGASKLGCTPSWLSRSCVGAPGSWRRKVRSQNRKQGMKKLVARHSIRQRLGDRACGLVQKGTISLGLAMCLSLPLQCVYTGRRFPVAGCLWCSVCSVCLCNAGGQHCCHCLCCWWDGHWDNTGLSLWGRVGTQCMRAVSQSGVGGNGKELCLQ